MLPISAIIAVFTVYIIHFLPITAIYIIYAIFISQFAKKWGVPERTIRNYCATGRIKGAFLTGKT